MVSHICITRNRFRFLLVFSSHKIVVWKVVYIVKPVLSHEGLAERYEPNWKQSECCLDGTFLPPPQFYLSDMWRELHIYTEFSGIIPQYTVSLSLSFVTHWFSPHHHHHQLKHHLPSSPYPEKDKVDPSLGCHYACFLLGPLASYSYFSTLPLSATVNAVKPPAWPSRELSELSGLELDGPLSYISFEGLWLSLTRSSLPSDCPEFNLIWVDSI